MTSKLSFFATCWRNAQVNKAYRYAHNEKNIFRHQFSGFTGFQNSLRQDATGLSQSSITPNTSSCKKYSTQILSPEAPRFNKGSTFLQNVEMNKGLKLFMTQQYSTGSDDKSLKRQTWKDYSQWLKREKKAEDDSPQKLSTTSQSIFPASSQEPIDIFQTPIAATRRVVLKYRGAAALQVEALWRQYYPLVFGGIAIFASLLLWKFMFSVASIFINFSQGLAKYGFFALSSSMVAFMGLYLRARYTINPDAVYRKAMRTLQVDSRALEALGAPLGGSQVRAYVLSGGTPRFKNWKIKLSSQRCFLIFPVKGSERKGLVSVAVKKKNGKFDFRLLALDVPTATEDARIYLIGEESIYKSSGGVISELRDPVVRALAKERDFEAEDDKEEAEEEAAELENREAKLKKKETIDS